MWDDLNDLKGQEDCVSGHLTLKIIDGWMTGEKGDFESQRVLQLGVQEHLLEPR